MILQFKTFEISSVAVNKPVNTGRKAKAVFFDVASDMEFVTIQLSSMVHVDRKETPYAGRDGNKTGAILAAKSLNTRTGLGTKRLPRWHNDR
jgi:hypothetical protein